MVHIFDLSNYCRSKGPSSSVYLLRTCVKLTIVTPPLTTNINC